MGLFACFLPKSQAEYSESHWAVEAQLKRAQVRCVAL